MARRMSQVPPEADRSVDGFRAGVSGRGDGGLGAEAGAEEDAARLVGPAASRCLGNDDRKRTGTDADHGAPQVTQPGRLGPIADHWINPARSMSKGAGRSGWRRRPMTATSPGGAARSAL